MRVASVHNRAERQHLYLLLVLLEQTVCTTTSNTCFTRTALGANYKTFQIVIREKKDLMPTESIPKQSVNAKRASTANFRRTEKPGKVRRINFGYVFHGVSRMPEA